MCIMEGKETPGREDYGRTGALATGSGSMFVLVAG